jgi:N-acetylglutamate synthase-like GNAT family acetyltransferase
MMNDASVRELEPIVRLAAERDTVTVASLVRDAYQPYVARIGRPPAPMKADHARAIADGAVWVIVLGTVVAGAITLQVGDTHMLIESVAVAPPMQRRGLGTRLLDFAEHRARELGLPDVHLYTNQVMTENLAYYVRHGYVETDHRVDGGFNRVFFTKRVMPMV